MRILHIANDYAGSTVYKNLVREMDHLKLEQTIYNPVRNPSLEGRNKIDFSTENSRIIYSPILDMFSDRIFYEKKIRKIVRDIERKTTVSDIELIHAHTWYSDGGVAFELYKRYGTPYIVTVRSTDVNLFFKYMVHLRGHGLRILLNAQKIIFISPSLKERLYTKPFFTDRLALLNGKSLIVPNGVDPFWLKCFRSKKGAVNNPVKLLYIGRFLKRKNVVRLIKAVRLLENEQIYCNLTLIGGGGRDSLKVLNLIRDDARFDFRGLITDKAVLAETIRAHDIFTMPSYNETFGLVYIEALSQGIPIIYGRNEGISGYFDNSVGEAVDCKSIKSIATGIRRVASDYMNYNFKPMEIVQNHDWRRIAAKLKEVYHSIVTH